MTSLRNSNNAMKKNRTKHVASTIHTRQSPDPVTALAVRMADKFNNILTTVLGACTLIDKDDHATGELLQYVTLIRTSAERAATLSDKLMCVGTSKRKAACPGSHSPDSISPAALGCDKKDSCDKVPANTHSDGAAT